jgi:hypothetical protein
LAQRSGCDGDAAGPRGRARICPASHRLIAAPLPELKVFFTVVGKAPSPPTGVLTDGVTFGYSAD